MNKKHVSGIVILVAVAALAAGTFYLYRNNKKKYANAITTLNASSQPLAWLLTLDEGYLKAWATGLKAGQTTFLYNGKNYNTQGGKATA